MTVRPLDDESRRRELIQHLNGIRGVAIPKEAAKRRPSFDMVLLRDDQEFDRFLVGMRWAIDQVRAAQATH